MIDFTLRSAVLVGVIVALGGSIMAYGSHREAQGAARVQALWDQQKLAQQGVAIAAQQDNATETKRRINAQKEVIRVQAQQLAKAMDDNATLRSIGERLRSQSARYLAAHGRGPSGHPDAPSAGSAAGSAAVVFSDLFSRADQAAGDLAEALERSRIAGLACERSYDALTP